MAGLGEQGLQLFGQTLNNAPLFEAQGQQRALAAQQQAEAAAQAEQTAGRKQQGQQFEEGKEQQGKQFEETQAQQQKQFEMASNEQIREFDQKTKDAARDFGLSQQQFNLQLSQWTWNRDHWLPVMIKQASAQIAQINSATRAQQFKEDFVEGVRKISELSNEQKQLLGIDPNTDKNQALANLNDAILGLVKADPMGQNKQVQANLGMLMSSFTQGLKSQAKEAGIPVNDQQLVNSALDTFFANNKAKNISPEQAKQIDYYGVSNFGPEFKSMRRNYVQALGKQWPLDEQGQPTTSSPGEETPSLGTQPGSTLYKPATALKTEAQFPGALLQSIGNLGRAPVNQSPGIPGWLYNASGGRMGTPPAPGMAGVVQNPSFIPPTMPQINPTVPNASGALGNP